MNEEEELKLVLELSERTVREHADSLLSQDEELARALEESFHHIPPQPVQPRSQPNQIVMDSENVPSSSSMPPGDAHSHGSDLNSRASSPLLAPSPVDAQLRDDEAFARRLEAEYESERTSPATSSTHSTDPSPSAFPQLPRYADVVGKEAGTWWMQCVVTNFMVHCFSTAVERSESDAVAPPRVQQVSPTSTPANDLLSTPDQANTPSRNSPSPAQRSSPRPEILETVGSSMEEEEVLESASSSPQSSRPLATPNEFVEPELLYGICTYPVSTNERLSLLYLLRPKNSVWVQHATDGQRRDARFCAKHYRSSLWEIPADVYSSSELAATLETDGEVECDPGGAVG
jgi:hypothetical protein